jgi:hypothetical protein
MKKFLIAATATVIATLSFATASQAGGFKWHHGHHGFHGAPFGLVVDLGPRVIVDDYVDCYVKKVRKYDRYGNLYIKKVRICD